MLVFISILFCIFATILTIVSVHILHTWKTILKQKAMPWLWHAFLLYQILSPMPILLFSSMFSTSTWIGFIVAAVIGILFTKLFNTVSKPFKKKCRYRMKVTSEIFECFIQKYVAISWQSSVRTLSSHCKNWGSIPVPGTKITTNWVKGKERERGMLWNTFSNLPFMT